MFENVNKADTKSLDIIRKLYRTLVGTEFCAWTKDYPGEKELQSDLSRNALFCIRDEASGEIMGVVSIDDDPEVESIPCWSEDLQPSAEISRLGVAEKYQNMGIGRELLAGAMEEIRKRGFRSAHMLVAKDNVKALHSYRKLKFEKVGEYVLLGHDYWCYEKSLE